MTQTAQQVKSEYFAEGDILAIQYILTEKNYISTAPGHNDPLKDPVVLAKVLDRLMEGIIAEMVESPEELFFGNCDGSHRRDFERAFKQVTGQEI